MGPIWAAQTSIPASSSPLPGSSLTSAKPSPAWMLPWLPTALGVPCQVLHISIKAEQTCPHYSISGEQTGLERHPTGLESCSGTSLGSPIHASGTHMPNSCWNSGPGMHHRTESPKHFSDPISQMRNQRPRKVESFGHSQPWGPSPILGFGLPLSHVMGCGHGSCEGPPQRPLCAQRDFQEGGPTARQSHPFVGVLR